MTNIQLWNKLSSCQFLYPRSSSCDPVC